MTKKPHLALNIKRQADPIVTHKFNYGGGKNDEEEDKNYQPMADAFQRSLKGYQIARKEREAKRNDELEVPAYIEYIEINFQDQFEIKKYNRAWYDNYGLEYVKFTNFNKTGLFAVIDQDKFRYFFSQIESFIEREEKQDATIKFDNKITFIDEFKLLTTTDIARFDEAGKIMLVDFFQFPLGTEIEGQIFESLLEYLNEREISYDFNEDSKFLEVYDLNDQTALEIADNFDIIYNITSTLATRIGPDELNIPKREYGFTVTAKNDLPIIGILDTGISNATPLNSIIIDDKSFNLTTESPFEDSANHGTAVAALAALGKRPYEVDFRGEIEADARLLSIKILSENQGFISIFGVLDLLHKAKEAYPEMKIFVLVTCFKQAKKLNEPHSTYAYELDKFSHEHNCLLCICTGNNSAAANSDQNRDYNFNYFEEENTFLSNPAESMNNLIVGAAGDNLRSGTFHGISSGREWPALYSRSSHIDLKSALKSRTKKFLKDNKNLFRPDVIAAGGDYEQIPGFIVSDVNATLELLSANPAEGFYNQLGTSFATPLVANMAARLQREYPTLKAQTLKALIINGANKKQIKTSNEKLIPKAAGHGLIDDEMSLYSNENAITIILEDSIKEKELKVYPLNFPKGYINEDLGKKSGILKVTATLCFSFKPVKDIQGAYCPLQMAFSVFKNHPAEDILKTNDEIESKLKTTLSWSQNNRYVSKPIPASNTQKISFLIDKKNLEDEDCRLKLAIHCQINDQLIEADHYKNTEHPFSIVVTVAENLKKGKERNKLYDEMVAINELVNISTLDVEVEGDLEG